MSDQPSIFGLRGSLGYSHICAEMNRLLSASESLTDSDTQCTGYSDTIFLTMGTNVIYARLIRAVHLHHCNAYQVSSAFPSHSLDINFVLPAFLLIK